MASYSVIAADGQAYGPADEATLAEWAREGRLTAQTVLRCDDTGAHHPAQSIPALAPLLGLPQHMVNDLVRQGQPAYQPASYQAPYPAGHAAAPLGYAQPYAYGVVPHGHGLEAFSTPVTILLHYLTLGIFSWIHFGLMHDRLPRLRQDDPSSVKAICFHLIPIFNLYWMFFEKLRLIDRLNEQRRFAGLPDGPNKGLFLTASILCFIPVLGWISFLILYPIFIGTLRASVNELVYATRARH